MKLHTYFRSSAAYRVRIALNLKGLQAEMAPHHLLRGGGEHLQDAYRAINPQAMVPALEDDGVLLTQSLAIIEYLDEQHRAPPLLPADAAGRARVRSLALAIACDIHPLANLRVLRYLVHTLGVTEEVKNAWSVHWVEEGLAALETQLARSPATGVFCHGDAPTLADCCLVPQVFNARRVNVDMAPYPTIVRIDAACSALPAFAQAHPSRQVDAE
jgi:maleylpyruvate isomerase